MLQDGKSQWQILVVDMQHPFRVFVGSRHPLFAACAWAKKKAQVFRRVLLAKSIHVCINTHITRRNAWVPFINGKLIVLGASQGPEGFVLTDSMWDEFCSVIKKSTSVVQTCLLKTVINSWYTSHRMPEVPKLPCIFGCAECKDNLKHYLGCEPLSTLAVCACGLPLPFLSHPLARLCILEKSVAGLKLLSVVFCGCHAVRLGHRDLVDYSIASWSCEVIHVLVVPIFKDMWPHL